MDKNNERINEREIICVICPNSCRLTVWRDGETGEVKVKGFQCPRGEKYGKNEYTNPVRMLITTMRIKNGTLPVIPVRTTEEIPKEKLLRAIKVVNDNHCKAPIKMGKVVIKNILGTRIDVVTSRNMGTGVDGSKISSKFDENNLNEILHFTLRDAIFGGSSILSDENKLKLEEAEKLLKKRLKAFGLEEKDI